MVKVRGQGMHYCMPFWSPHSSTKTRLCLCFQEKETVTWEEKRVNVWKKVDIKKEPRVYVVKCCVSLAHSTTCNYIHYTRNDSVSSHLHSVISKWQRRQEGRWHLLVRKKQHSVTHHTGVSKLFTQGTWWLSNHTQQACQERQAGIKKRQKCQYNGEYVFCDYVSAGTVRRIVWKYFPGTFTIMVMQAGSVKKEQLDSLL